MAQQGIVAATSVAGVVAAVAVGAVLLWPTGPSNGPRSAGAGPTPSASASSEPDVVDGIRNGSRVSASGTVALVAERFRLCLDFSSYDCSELVHLRDPDRALADAVDENRTVTGVWDAGWIEVRKVQPAPRDDYGFDLVDPPCRPPDGGWAHLHDYNPKTPNLDPAALESYEHAHPHVLTGVAFFRPTELQPVLTVASTEADATRAELAPAYPDALCVVASRHSREEVQDAYHRMLRAQADGRLPGLYEMEKDFGPDGQTTISLTVRNDRAEIEEAVRGMPADLVVVHPIITVLDPA